MPRDELRQIVYLSNRPTELNGTLRYVARHMPWVEQAVVCGPASTLEALSTEGLGLELVLVDERDVVPALAADHVTRNAALRRGLYVDPRVDDVFLQSDDDYRPLRPVGRDAFLDDEGRIVSYACHDLALWRHDESSFDRGLHAAYLALSFLGVPGRLCFASHQPQAIDRALFLEAFAAAGALDPSGRFCEWSLPLNHGRHVAPERFGAIRTFRTMGWPRYPHEWPFWRRPEDIAFENFHPELYAGGELFDGLDPDLDPDPDRAAQVAFTKLQRWYRFDLDFGRQRPTDVADPWRKGSRRRRAFFRAVGLARRAWEYVALEERTAQTQLFGRLDERGDR